MKVTRSNRLTRLTCRALAVLSIAVASPAAAPELTQLIASGHLSELIHPDFSGYRMQLEEFYKPSNYSLAWSRGGSPSPQALALIEILRDAGSKGLDPEDYDGSRWAGRLSKWGQPGLGEADLARFDMALTVSAIRYVSDLAIGRIDLRTAGCRLDPDPPSCDVPSLLRQVAVGGEAKAVLAAAEPPYPGYQRTLTALGAYRRLALEESVPLPSLEKTIKPGAPYAGASQLAHLLQRLGDLPEDFPTGDELAVYSDALVEAVIRFQIRHGLDPDGRIGKQTLQHLNTPLSSRVRQLQLTLERWRWAPHEFSQPPIVVNIPEFNLRALGESYRAELEMKVVVGRAYRHQTPVFASGLTYLIFQPYWNVPRSIQRAELVPHLERDRSYLTKHGYQMVTRSGQVVAGDPVTDELLQKLRKGELMIRQVPGPTNALGRVKFIFPNEDSVYLHDTPSRQLFSRTRRDFSHGCIRVENPEALAAWVLRNNPDWPAERVAEAINGERTIQVNLKEPIPVLIVYGTAVVLESGEVRFFDDIYGYDQVLEKRLANRRSDSAVAD